MKKIILFLILMASCFWEVKAQTACADLVGTTGFSQENSLWGLIDVYHYDCLDDILLDPSCSVGAPDYHIRVAEFDLATGQWTKDYHSGWEGTTVPTSVRVSDYFPANEPTCGKIYAVGFVEGPTWNPAPVRFFTIDCTDIPLWETYACKENLHNDDTSIDIATDQLHLQDGTRVITGYTRAGSSDMRLFIERINPNGSIDKMQYPIQGDAVSNVQIILDEVNDEFILFFDTRVSNNRDVFLLRVTPSSLSPIAYESNIVDDIGDEYAMKMEDNLNGTYMLLVNQETSTTTKSAYLVYAQRPGGFAFTEQHIQIGASTDIQAYDIIETAGRIGLGCSSPNRAYLICGYVDNEAFIVGADCNGDVFPQANTFDVDGNSNTRDVAKRIDYDSNNDKFYIAGERLSFYSPGSGNTAPTQISGRIWLGEFDIDVLSSSYNATANWINLYENSSSKTETVNDLSFSDGHLYLTGQTNIAELIILIGQSRAKAYINKFNLSGDVIWSKNYYDITDSQTKINDIELVCGSVQAVGNCNDIASTGSPAVESPINRFIYKNKLTLDGLTANPDCVQDIGFSKTSVTPTINTINNNQINGQSFQSAQLGTQDTLLVGEMMCCSYSGLCAPCPSTDSLSITTGVNPFTNVLTACGVGNIDPHWRLINNPPLPGCTNPLIPATGDAFLINHNNLAIPSWVNQTGATALAPYDGGCDLNFGCDNPTNASGQPVPYVFERTFCVCDDDEVAIDLTLEGDDRVHLELWDISNNTLLDTSPTYIWSGTATVNWNIVHALPIGTYAIRAYLVNTNSTTLGFSVVGSVTSLTGRPTVINDNICCTNNTVNIRKVIDNNCNGVFDNGDLFGTGWTFELYDATGTTLLQTEVTDINGELFFNNVNAGTYQVVETPQAGFTPFGTSIQTITVSPGSFNVLEFYNCPVIISKCDSIRTDYTPTQDSSDYCCFDIHIDNLEDQCFTNIAFTPLGGVQFSSWNLNDPFNWTFASAGSGSIDLVALGNPFIPSGSYVPLSFCLDNYTTTPQEVLVEWFAADGTVCLDTLQFECSACIEVVQDTLTCDDNGYKYTFDFYNSWDKPVYNIVVENVTPAGTIHTSNITPIGAPVMPGSTSIGNCIFFDDNVADYGDTLCFNLRAEDIDDCCFCVLDPICIPVPDCCDECEDIEYDITNISIQNDSCCFDVDFYICEDSLFTCVEAVPLGGVILDYQAAGSGWYLFNPMPNSVYWKPAPAAPGSTFIPSGWTNNKMRFCLGGYDDPTQFPPEEVVIRWKSDLQTVVCQDTLVFNCMPPPIEHCAEVVNDTIVCNDDGTFTFNYDVENVSGINASNIRIDYVHTKPAGGILSPTPPYNVGGVFPPNSITPMPPMNISSAMPSDSVCFVVTLFDNEQPVNECCHTDTLCFVLPDCCENINGDFEDFTGAWDGTNIWINTNLTNWSVSHGTPTYSNSSLLTSGRGIWMWSADGRGEGVYTDYNFVTGNSYTLTYDLYRYNTSDPSSTFHVELLNNGLNPYGGGASNFPAPSSTPQSISTQTWATNGTWTTITETFIASPAHTQVWFYPFLAANVPGTIQAAVLLDNVCIVDNGLASPMFCDPVIDLGTSTIPSGTIHAQNEVFSAGTIPAGTNVSLKAGQCIRLEGGFSSDAAADLEIIIEDCEPDVPD